MIIPYQADSRAIAYRQQKQPQYSGDDTSETAIFLEIDLPAPIACEVDAHPELLGNFWNDATHVLRKYWSQKIQTGQMDEWAPLAPATIKAKEKAGVGLPAAPMVGTHGSVVQVVEHSLQTVEVQQTPEGHMVGIAFGPGPGEDQHPSERWADLFQGYPRLGKPRVPGRAPIPARPLSLDQGAQQLLQQELQRWNARIQQNTSERFCFDEAITRSLVHSEGSKTKLLTGSTGPQYVLEA